MKIFVKVPIGFYSSTLLNIIKDDLIQELKFFTWDKDMSSPVYTIGLDLCKEVFHELDWDVEVPVEKFMKAIPVKEEKEISTKILDNISIDNIVDYLKIHKVLIPKKPQCFLDFFKRPRISTNLIGYVKDDTKWELNK